MTEQYSNLQGEEQDAKLHPNTNLEHPEPGPGSSFRSAYTKKAIDESLNSAANVAKEFNPFASGKGAKTPYNTRNSF